MTNPAKLLLLGLVVVAPIAGWGVYSAVYRQSEIVEEASEDELAFLGVPDDPIDADQLKPANATLTDVVSAVHTESMDERPAVTQVAGQRPASNPSAWLAGTIEEVESAPPRTIEPFNRSAGH